MADLRMEDVGTFTDAHGDEVSVRVMWDAEADPEDEQRFVVIGDSLELDQEGAEAFARLFVSACWEAARCGTGQEPSEPEGARLAERDAYTGTWGPDVTRRQE